ncbi:hypothetical protein ACFSJW_08520 [Flavobacterium artemisiae]|uniref:Uncharacterized protein n=1 Tax=Flavobacterium artemisiae TaxID=2126556 RepID=A0ABW4HFD4_9FLAO
MYYNILTQKDHPKYQAVKKILKLLVEFVEADCIYFSDSAVESKTGILTIVVSNKSPNYYDDVVFHLWKVVENYNNFSFCFFDRECIKREVGKGNLFFIFNCKETDLVYRNTVGKPVLDIKKINMKRLLKKTVANYQMWILEVNTIGRDLKYHRGNENHLMALYVIHEQFRYLFINASWVLTGEWVMDGKISDQQERIAKFNSVLGNTFDLDNKEEKEVLRKLDLARKAVQWGEEIEPLTAEIVDSAYEKMKWLMTEVKTMYQQYAEQTKQIFKEYGNQ